MTLPEQSDRAVAQTREFLLRLASPYLENGIKGIRREVRAEALALLRHYPYAWLSQKCDCPAPDNAAKQDTPTDAVPSQPFAWAVHYGLDPDPEVHWGYPRHAAESGRMIVPLYRSPTLTDAEREAVTWAAITADSEYDSRRAATLRGLLERLG